MGSISSAAASVPAPSRSLGLARLGDELLARYAARGSQRAFAAIYERYHQPLYRYCRSIVRDDADAQDALQSALTGALTALRRDQRNAPLRPWLYRIAHNEAVSLLRRRKREADPSLAVEFAGAVSSAEDEATERARWRTLIEDLTRLPERQRGALLLRELSGLSHEEIAIVLGTTIGGAKQSIFEARRGLAELQEGRDMSCDEVRRLISDGDGRALRARRVRAHLRECAGCAAFADAIPGRRSELRAFAPPLPPAAAATLLARSLRAASPHGGAGAASASAAAGAGAAGKAAGTALGWKALTGAALIATAAAGVTGLTHVIHPGRASVRDARLASHHARGAAGGATGHSGVLAHARDAAGARNNRATLTASAPRGNPAASALGQHHGRSAGTTGAAPTAAGRSGSHASGRPGHSRGTTSPGHKIGSTPRRSASSRSPRARRHPATRRHSSSTHGGALRTTRHATARPSRRHASIGSPTRLRGSSAGPARHVVQTILGPGPGPVGNAPSVSHSPL